MPDRLRYLLIAVFLLVVVGGITDLILDRPTTLLSLHVAFEVGLVLLSLTAAGVLWRGWAAAERELGEVRSDLATTRRSLEERQRERDAWKRQAETALAGLGEAIGDQFTRWGLTPAEREVALGLLKGLGHKQVAAATGRSERTVRQHAVAVYEKSGLGGRAELAAFFLGGLSAGDGAGTTPGSGPVYSRLPRSGP